MTYFIHYDYNDGCFGGTQRDTLRAARKAVPETAIDFAVSTIKDGCLKLVWCKDNETRDAGEYYAWIAALKSAGEDDGYTGD